MLSYCLTYKERVVDIREMSRDQWQTVWESLCGCGIISLGFYLLALMVLPHVPAAAASSSSWAGWLFVLSFAYQATVLAAIGALVWWEEHNDRAAEESSG
jgi:hypothetical protein